MRKLFFLGCLLVLFAPLASFASPEAPESSLPLLSSLQQETGTVCLAQIQTPQQPAAPTLRLGETTLGESPEACSATFCMRCADLCCPTPAGGCICCSGD